MKESDFEKLLKYLDEQFYDEKVTESHRIYYALTLDWYFEDSILATNYLNIEDYIDNHAKIIYDEHKQLSAQFESISEDKKFKLIECLYNIIFYTHKNRDFVQAIAVKMKNYLERLNIKVFETENSEVYLTYDNKLGEGYYCEVFRVSKGIIKKKLKPDFTSNENITKRLKYEFEMMKKLSDCPKIMTVLEYDPTENSYLMLEADENLYDFTSVRVDLPLEQKIKIILDILEAINCAHKKHIIHRDLHLGNIMRLGDDFLVCDFGLGKDKDMIRSLVTSATSKNSHWFVDPIGLTDFTKLDEKSDIYSIGKIIDYLMCNGTNSVKHEFSSIVNKCTYIKRELRYNSIDEIIEDISNVVSKQENLIKYEKISNNIIHGGFDLETKEFILSLLSANKLCYYIVHNSSFNIYEIIKHFDAVERQIVASHIRENYASAVGPGMWSKYSLFGKIAFNSYYGESEEDIKNIYIEIVKECADTYNRFDIQDLLKSMI